MKKFHNNYIPFVVLLLTLSWPLQADLLQPSTITAIDSELNQTSFTADNLRDDNSATRWLSGSNSHTNDINFQFNDNGDAFCFDSVDLINYGNDDKSVKNFMLLSSSDTGISGDTSTSAIGWKPVVADNAPSGLINYLSWAQGGRLDSIDSQYNTTVWAAKNSHDGSPFSRWLSKSYQTNNIFEFTFDTDWDGSTGNGIPIEEIEITNYGNDDRSIKELQIEVTTDGTNWFKLEVPGTLAGDSDYIFTQRQEGGILGTVDSQYHTATTWAAANIQDGNQLSRWLSKSYQGNNTIAFTFDPDNDGQTGANGDIDDLFNIDKFHLENYGIDDRSIKEFQVAVKTLFNSSWSKVTVPGATIGTPGYNFLLSHHGAELITIDSQYNNTNWGADNIHDGDHMTRWLSKNLQSNNVFEFQFDVNEDGNKNVDDHFTIDSFFLQNYGNDDRSIREFQVSVKTASDPSWQKIKVPGAAIGTPDYNFLLKEQGGTLAAVNSQYNSTSWAAKNIHDGSQMTRWLSANKQSKNTLAFTFDVDEDGNTGTASDLFVMESFYLANYGVDDRSIKEFQVAVKTLGEPTWQKIKVPGSIIGTADHNFLLADHGGVLATVDSQYNTTSWAAKNIHDGSQMTRWLSLNTQFSNTLGFQFDINEDGTLGGIDDLFTMEKFYLQNYGNDDRSIKEFQIEVKTSSNTNWTKVQVPGTAANDPNYNFSLAAHGGELTFIDSQYNTTSWAAKNIHDGNQISRWLSRSNQMINTLEFTFDADNNGSLGDPINLDTIELINYGNDDRSIQTFEIDIQISGGAWQPVNAPGGGTIFTANMDRNGQRWSVDPQTNVTATRIRTLSNYGDANYIGASEITFSGVSVGPSHTFTAAMHGNGETFELITPIIDVTDVRLSTISNHGDPNYIGATEFKVLGLSTIESSTFVAAMHGNGETFTLTTPLVDVTDVKLMTISNHGDPNYVGAKEFKVLGPSITKTATFVAAMHGDGETFILDNDDIPVDVTDVKLTTISNHGDPNYVGAKEFKVLGNAITETKTFIAAMHGDGETFVLDSDDVPEEVTDVKLITISNHGDPSYVGAREFEVIGHSVTPAHTFVLPMQADPYRIALDNDDTVSDVIGARIITIRNHGDSNYIGAADFQLLGTAIGPSYVFEAAMDSSTQHFTFSPLNSNLLRFHTLNNYGDPTYTGASELVLNSGVCPTGQWHMDEASWSGTAGEVIDSSGGEHAGTVFGISTGLADPDTAISNPAIASNPGTCRYGEFDGIDDYIEIPDSEDLDNTSQITISAWFNAKSFTQTNGTNARGLFSKRPSSSSNVSYGAFFWNEHGNNLYIDIDGTNNRFASNTSFNSDTWYHIAIVYDGTQIASQRVRLYVNGLLDGIFTESSSSIPDTASNFYIGNLYTGLDQLKVFDGAIDEVNVIPEALTADKVLALKNATQPCEVSPVFLNISTTGNNASTCAAKPITIRACQDLACNTLVPNYGGNIGISVSNGNGGGHGDWSINSASGTLTNAVSDDGAASYSFDSALDESSVILNLNNSHAETVTITVNDTNASVTAISDTIEFSDNAFVIDHGDNLHIAGRPQPMSVSLYTQNDGLCAINTSYTNSKDVKMWLDRDLADPSGTAPTISATTLPNASSINFKLTFTNGIASFDLASTDVGKYDFNIVDDSLLFSDQNIDGVTNIITRPFGFDVSVSGDSGEINPKASTASDGKFIAAGDNFTVKVIAVAWESADDLDNDGIPDGHDDFDPSNNANLSDNSAVNSFGMENDGQAESVITSAYEISPILNTLTNVLEDGISPCINCNITDFTSGKGQSGSVYYNEVGIIEVTTALKGGSYLGGAKVIGASGFVGRFVPHHFMLTKEFDGELSGGNGFVYTGQMDISDPDKGAITYAASMEPSFTITAVSSKEDSITKNYTGNFMKLSETGIEWVSPLSDSIKTSSALEANLLSAQINEKDGVITYTFNAGDNFVYTRNAAAVIDKFPATIDLIIKSVKDSDDVIAFDSNDTTLEDNGDITNTNGVLMLTPNLPAIGLDIYFGRWYLQNSYGPETSPLTVPMEIQYWNGSNFVINTLESAQTLDATNLDVTDIDLSPGITTETGSGTFENGVSRSIILSAPGDGEHGNVTIEYNAPSWLLYDWENEDTFLDGPYKKNPTATATFGLYRGNDRIIYWREVQ